MYAEKKAEVEGGGREGGGRGREGAGGWPGGDERKIQFCPQKRL